MHGFDEFVQYTVSIMYVIVALSCLVCQRRLLQQSVTNPSCTHSQLLFVGQSSRLTCQDSNWYKFVISEETMSLSMLSICSSQLLIVLVIQC